MGAKVNQAKLFLLGCLTVSSAILAEPAGTTTESISVFQKVKARYWTKYNGSPVADIGSRYTTSSFGETGKQAQSGDNLLTLGYQMNSTFRPGVGLPFQFQPISHNPLWLKPPYVGLTDFTILETGPFSVHGDARLYLPIGDMASFQEIKTGLRTSQLALYRVPNSNWLLGSSSYVRSYRYAEFQPGVHGEYRSDFEIYFSPFASYRMTDKLAAMVWVDLLQLSHKFGTTEPLVNLPVDIQPGIVWTVAEGVSVNPYLNFIPSALRLDNINWGVVVMAALT